VRWLLPLFFIVPLLELYLLLWTGSQIGFWPTVAATLAAALLGSYLAKREGLKVWREWQRAINELRPPTQGVIDGVLVLVGGALLVAPGFITDITGLVLLFPPTRKVVASLVRRAVNRRIDQGQIRVHTIDFRPGASRAGGVIETTGESLEDDSPAARDEKPALR
jgi:UPF0716 protein FxsA